MEVPMNSLIAPDFGAQLQSTLTSVSEGLILFLISAGVFLVGWLLAAFLSRLIQSLFSLIGVDASYARLRQHGVLAPELPPSRFAGYIMFWAIILAAVLISLRIVGMDLAPSIAARLQDVVPRVLTSALVLLLGIPIALAAGRVLGAMLASTGVRLGRLRSQVIVSLLVVFVVLLALEQLGLAAQLVMAVGIAAVGAVGLGLALAFGLGCRDLARDLVVEYLRASDHEAPTERP
jgi:mechanosensitive ion channel-like protein